MLRVIVSLLPVVIAGASRAEESPRMDFRTDVIAALSRGGCNQGACHGSPQGKNGFRLSLRGADPGADFATLVREQGGRRVNRQSPAQSLILMKATGAVAHQGGVIFSPQHPAYRAIVGWIGQGCEIKEAPAVTRLEVLPGDTRLPPNAPSLALTVQARFADGSSRDVTDLAVFSSSHPDLAPVTPAGKVEFRRTGEASILVRYLQSIASVRLSHVKSDAGFVFRGPGPANFVDEFIFAKQRDMRLIPAAVAPDEVFLRRAYLDVTGVLPTPDEAAAFLDSKDPDKRSKLADQLLARDEYASHWALKWADVLRGSPVTISERGVHSFHRYLVRAMAEDRPVTALARELLTGLGNTLNKPAANFFRIARTPEDAAETVAQLFMGVRVQCSRCHNHPFENITQADYYGLAAFFARVQFKGAQFGLDDEIVYLDARRELNNPLTKKPQPPVAFSTPAEGLGPDDDRRVKFADWLTSPENRFFAPAVANRVWFHLLGKGIVDPVDDFRDTNPPSNPQLLKALADDFARHGYRMKPLIRTIITSRTYQLAAQAPRQDPNAADQEAYFTHAAVRMLTAEQVLDAVSSATGVHERFKGYPAGTRALELPEGGVIHPFLQAFSKPVRDVTCECAREDDPGLPQVLHMLNNAQVVGRIRSPESRVAQWLKGGREPSWIVDQMYLATLTRRPTAKEKTLVLEHIRAGGDPEGGLQDLQHALLNLNEFLLRH